MPEPRFPHQIVRVRPASERERNIESHRSVGIDRPPMRAYLYDGGHLVKVYAVSFDDTGVPKDIRWRAPSLCQITKIMFVFEGRSFLYPVEPPVVLQAGDLFHVALAHMRLLTKFGVDYLAYRKGQVNG